MTRRRCIPMDSTDGPNVVALWEEGVPVTWVARYTGRPVGSVIGYLQRRGVWAREKAPEIDAERAMALLAGRTFVAVAERLGCTEDGLRRAVRRAGLPRRYTDMTEEEAARIREMYADGVPWRQIRKASGRSASCVLKALEGVPRRGHGRRRTWAHPWHRERTAEIERQQARMGKEQ